MKTDKTKLPRFDNPKKSEFGDDRDERKKS